MPRRPRRRALQEKLHSWLAHMMELCPVLLQKSSSEPSDFAVRRMVKFKRPALLSVDRAVEPWDCSSVAGGVESSIAILEIGFY